MLPTDDKERKALPVFDGVVMYFPDALAAVAAVSKAGNDQHNPGEPLHWAREKSTDQLNTAMRHMMDYGRGNLRDTDGSRHLAKAAWRILAELQLSIERESQGALDIPSRCENVDHLGCPSHSPQPYDWGCERPAGHSGDHMAWDIYPTKFYDGGVWK